MHSLRPLGSATILDFGSNFSNTMTTPPPRMELHSTIAGLGGNDSSRDAPRDCHDCWGHLRFGSRCGHQTGRNVDSRVSSSLGHLASCVVRTDVRHAHASIDSTGSRARISEARYFLWKGKRCGEAGMGQREGATSMGDSVMMTLLPFLAVWPLDHDEK